MLFIKHGLDGVKMQMVADRAEVNKGLLHYYFKTKEKIFLQVFERVSEELFARLMAVFADQQLTDDEKISKLVDTYFALFDSNRQLPLFFISEINRNPEILKRLGVAKNIKKVLRSAEFSFSKQKSLDQLVHFMLSLISLSAFPFFIAPLLGEITGSQQKAESVLFERKKMVKKVLKNIIDD